MASLLLGCGAAGTQPAERKPENVVRSFLEAAEARDGATACSLMTSSARTVMASYGQRFRLTADRANCESTVNGLGRLPQPAVWKAMAKGSISVGDATGLDNRTVEVSYVYHGQQLRSIGAVIRSSSLDGGYDLSIPPTPETRD